MATLDRHPTRGSYKSDEKDDLSPKLAVNSLPHDEELSQSPKRDIDDGFDLAMLKRVTRKIDLRLVPYLAACYSVSLIDRTNISLANIAGMGKELQLTGQRYNICVIMFVSGHHSPC